MSYRITANGGRLCGRCEAMTQSCGYRMARRAMRLPTKPPTIIEKPAGLFDNYWLNAIQKIEHV
jgi:hypothetical protein